jgi:hypothetical protein
LNGVVSTDVEAYIDAQSKPDKASKVRNLKDVCQVGASLNFDRFYILLLLFLFVTATTLLCG